MDKEAPARGPQCDIPIRSRAGWGWLGLPGIMLGLLILVGAPVLNEIVDDYGLTATARKHLENRRRAQLAWDEAKREASAKANEVTAAQRRLRDAAPEQQ